MDYEEDFRLQDLVRCVAYHIAHEKYASLWEDSLKNQCLLAKYIGLVSREANRLTTYLSDRRSLAKFLDENPKVVQEVDLTLPRPGISKRIWVEFVKLVR